MPLSVVTPCSFTTDLVLARRLSKLFHLFGFFSTYSISSLALFFLYSFVFPPPPSSSLLSFPFYLLCFLSLFLSFPFVVFHFLRPQFFARFPPFSFFSRFQYHLITFLLSSLQLSSPSNFLPKLNFALRISAFEIQLSIEAAVLVSLIKSVRDGKYICPQIGKPKSIVLIGHSFGSATSNAALAQASSLVDAAVLTGYGLNGSSLTANLLGFAPRIARIQDPKRFSLYDYAYTVTADVYATITIFFKAPDYDRAIARFLEATKGPFSLFEILTFGGTPSPAYKNPVLVISGEFDYPICGGVCTGVLDDGLKDVFPNAPVDTYVQPGAGHATNFALNAPSFYGEIFKWLGKKGL